MRELKFLYKKDKSRDIFIAQVCKELDVTVAAINFIFIDDKLNTIEFNSYRFGITKYSIAQKKFTGNIWESENDAKAISNLNYHYTSFGLNGTANEETNRKNYKFVLNEIQQEQLTKLVTRLIDFHENIDEEMKKYVHSNYVKTI